MAAFIPLFSVLHLLGAVLGCAGITLAEIFYLQAARDGRIDAAERSHIRSTYWAMKWGLSLALLAGVALSITQFEAGLGQQAVMYSALWMQDTLALVIIVSGWGLAARRISWAWATALAFSAWWMMLFLHAWLTTPISFGQLLFLYVIFAGITAIVFGYLRTLFHVDQARSVS